jgi:threonyl-tRNA synthetase
MCYRDEQTGELTGITRARAFTQDDAHVFCAFQQAKAELAKIWDIVQTFYQAFGFSLRVRLSLHDPKQMEKYLGDHEIWPKAEEILRELATEMQADTFDGIGEAAFYGPKLDFMAKDAIGREHQLATIQLDLNMANRFKLEYIASDGSKQTPVMIHAAIMGSIERFMGVLIEHFAGAFPLWLSPVQVSVLPISDKHLEYANSVIEKLMAVDEGLRIELDDRSESIGKKIREATNQKVPYMLIMGDKEVESQAVAVRTRAGEDLGSMSIDDLASKLKQEISTKA